MRLTILALVKELVSVYDLTKLSDDADAPAEVRIKCFLPRENPTSAFRVLDLEIGGLAGARVL